MSYVLAGWVNNHIALPEQRFSTPDDAMSAFEAVVAAPVTPVEVTLWETQGRQYKLIKDFYDVQ
jgi:hypothetical protein